MNYWLMKNEPEDYNIDDLARDKVEPVSYTHLTLPTSDLV